MTVTNTVTPTGDWQYATYSGGPTPGGTNGKQVGWAPGQPALYLEWGMPAAVPKRELHVSQQLLPELDENQSRSRKLYQRPAFIVSMILTLVTIGVGVALLVIGVFSSGVATVTALSGELGDDNVRLTWSGDDVAYGLYAVDGGSGPVLDLTPLVRDHEAWIPVNARLFDDGTCFVVRSIAGFEQTAVSIEATKLEEQGAQRICVADL